MDVIQRLESAVVEMERERECVCVVAHQAVLRAVYGYFTKAPPEVCPGGGAAHARCATARWLSNCLRVFPTVCVFSNCLCGFVLP